ncbi:MAG: VWA domain-containing protein [Pleurocapsa minor GSE-CHR-MK-17-07R]|jgi:hypothetical protein|nr:VWA domain-containing protein [Pleurocapsa minor GSE-CHR-MK 17-07R]
MLHAFIRPTLLTLGAAIAAGFVLAQGGGPMLEVTGANTSQFPEIILTANVEQASGQPIDGLSEANFSITGEGGQACVVSDVVNVSEDDITFATVLAIDVSDSMIGQPLELARQAARLYVESLRPTDSVGVVTFASSAQVLQPVTTDHEAVLAAIDSITNDGQTALYQGTFDAINLAADASIDRRVVILLSDGAEFGGLSSVTPADVLALAGERFITVYTIGLGFGPDRAFLQDVSAATGGQYTESPTADELAGIYTELGRLLSSQYVITLACDLPADGTEYTLTLQADADGATLTDDFSFRAPVPVPIISLPDFPARPIAEPVTITAEVLADDPLTSVGFTIDETPISEQSEPPFTLDIDPYLFGPGAYALTVSATDEDGDAAQVTAPLEIAELPILINVTGLESGGVISEDNRVDFSFTSQSPVNHVAVFIDGVDLAHLVREPWGVTIRPLSLSPGAHELFIAADSATGLHGELRIPFTISDAPYQTATALAPTATLTPSHTPSNTPTPSATPTATATFTATLNSAATGTAQAVGTQAQQLAQAQTGTAQAAITQSAADADATQQAATSQAQQQAVAQTGTMQALGTQVAAAQTGTAQAEQTSLAATASAGTATVAAIELALAATSTTESVLLAQTATADILTADAAALATSAAGTATFDAAAAATADARATANAISRTQALAATRDALATSNAEARLQAQQTNDARATERARGTLVAATQAVQGTQTANARATTLADVNATGTALAASLATTTAQSQQTATRAMLETLVVEQQQTVDALSTATAAARATGTAQANIDATATTGAQFATATAVAQQTIGARETINARSGATATAEAIETLAMAQAAVSTSTDDPQPEETASAEAPARETPSPQATLVTVIADGQSADTTGSLLVPVCAAGTLIALALAVFSFARRKRS